MKNSIKLMKVLLTVSLLSVMFPYHPIHAADSTNPATAQEVLDRINRDMHVLYGLEDNYYKSSITKDGRTLGLRTDLIQKRLNQAAGQGGGQSNFKSNTFEIVYGGDHGQQLFHKGQTIMEYSGYSRDGHSVPAEGVPWFSGWSGTKIQNFDMIRQPWANRAVMNKYQIRKKLFDNYKDPNNKYLEKGTFEKSIISGLNIVYGGKKYEEFMYQNKDAGYKERTVYDKNAKPKGGRDWVEYVHILQPPTELSWGFGTIYINSSIGITYLDIPLAPFKLQNLTDLSAQFEALPTAAAAGDQVRVSVKVNSTFVDPVTSHFEWRITRKSNGARLTAQGDRLAFSGHAAAESGSLRVAKNESRVLYATFIMPDSDVRIQFSINKDGKAPEEALLSNNVLDSDPVAVKLIRPIKLPFDVLSTRVKFPLNSGRPIKATLRLPEGWWVGNAKGLLQVMNDTSDLFRDFKVENNPPVNEARETITRNPVVHTTINREDFGDDPLNGRWLNNLNKPIRRSGTVSYDGYVNRDYRYIYTTCDTNDKGKEVCTNHTEEGTAYTDFNSGQDRKIYDVYVYNGLDKLPKPTYKDEIEHNTRDAKNKDLYWENEPYTYDVIRWMHHVNEHGNPYNPTAVPGQYERVFTQQASAQTAWKNESTMAEQYHTARKAARDGKNKKSLYDKAVFATDRQLQKYAYPIKSGYYFNPAGKYTFTVKTVTYKQSDQDTEDHKDLVDTLTNSFRYETNLIYINDDKEAVNIANQPLDRKGGGFRAVPGILTAEHPEGVSGAVLLKVLDRSSDEKRYTKKVEEIYASQDPDGRRTHPFWKKVLEGYSESYTESSNNFYKYREYVRNGQEKLYKITETTKVTFELNPDNIPVYTHANMQNGKYYVKTWIDDAALDRGDHTYKKLGTLRGIDTLDNIEITVVGSMFDDLNQ
ncbi:hypothetical protein [Paenibacillus caui]|uniref:hypothetical protein n=1 Tax=Paenibacillus caui TaxID=2873927 RepID=UPI001CA8E438|nr:hypothetical protein [Paenibacillus caui]